MRTAGDESALEDVEYALDRIDDIIDDVLTLAREGTDVQNTEPVSLESVARTAWETVDTRALSLSIDSDMRVEADPDRLQRALENLFRNTIEHATLAAGASDDAEESIGDEATVVRIGPLEDRTGFFVEDDGSGIEPDQRDKVFERGYSTASEGTGLGLVIVQELVQAHGWSMQVADERNGGARFEISI
ncbi:MAG: two-component system OmpR family sensor kinase [Natrialbaceae archaeon]|jgi:two-component system OmpR family sensor kinase